MVSNLKEILTKHKKWLLNEDGGERADLCGADLRGADLCGADLRGANLRKADLREADLCEANFRGADLCGADLREANLYGADLRGADLRGADLRGADLRGADLREADLREANLCGADLREADLCGTDLFVPMACPDHGAFIGWKKCRGEKIVKLEIPEDAMRSSATGRKCRCSKALVLDIQDKDGDSHPNDCAFSRYDPSFVYKVGCAVAVDDFCEDRFNECAAGIHFFINREEAVNYEY